MRSTTDLLNSFLPKHEKEWDARLFVDQAIKESTERQLEILARALSGICEIRIKVHQEPQEQVTYADTDCNTFPKKTIKYTHEAYVDTYVFFGNNKTQLYLQIIDFWAGKVSIFPCAGASFPNSEISSKYSDLHKSKD